MGRTFPFAPAILPPLVVAVLLATLAVYAWRRRRAPGALPFSLAAVCATLWAAAAACEALAVAAPAQVFWAKAQGICQLPMVTATACFIVEYVWPGRWLNRRNLLLLSLPSLLFLALALTNDWHHLAWRGFALDERGASPLIGPATRLLFLYAYTLVAIRIVASVSLFRRSPESRWVAVLWLIATVGAHLVYTLDRRLDMLTLAFSFLAYAVALFGLRMFDPIPLARRAVIAQMSEGMLVLDAQGRIANLNPAAQRILARPAGQLRGAPIHSLLPDADAPLISATGEWSRELQLGSGSLSRCFVLVGSPLRDWRGVLVGHLLLLRDVTEWKLAQAQILEQQQALTMVREREQLARELHDSLSQDLAYINVQAQAVQLLLQRGQHVDADAYLSRLAEVARTLQAEMRALICQLLTISDRDLLLGSALRQVVARFEQQTGLQARLALDDGAESLCQGAAVPPPVVLQLARIAQEALANVGKHAGVPTDVTVRLTAAPDSLRMVIADNGAGFDAAHAERPDGHFGLQVMDQRARSIGGRITVRSSPGQGTSVEVLMPLQQAVGPVGAGRELT